MTLRCLTQLTFAIALAALSSWPVARAQVQPPRVVANKPQAATTVLPVRDLRDDSIQAFLLLEFPNGGSSSLERMIAPRQSAGAGVGVIIPMAKARRLSAHIALDAQPDVSVFCQGMGVAATLGSLAEHCLLGGFDAGTGPAAQLSLRQPAARAELRLESNQGQLAASFGLDRYARTSRLSLPGVNIPLALSSNPHTQLTAARVEEHALGLRGQLALGDEGWLSVGGTWARARLVSARDLTLSLPSKWDSQSLRFGAGIGNFGGEVVGHTLNIPGQTRNFSTVGLGVTWKTPWRAQLTVGAENLITRGKNPFTLPSTSSEDEGRVPYVRYQQDL